MKIIFYILIFSIIYCCNSCKPDDTPKKVWPKMNIIVLLDLSDRLLKDDQIDRDRKIINNLYAVFLKRVQSQFYFQAKDEFRVVLSYQDNVFPNSEIYKIENRLYTNMEQIKVTKKVEIKNSVPYFQSNIRDLYKLARFSENPNDYTGADIQGYLKNRLNDDISVGTNTINKLFILTDGYQYVKGKSKGLDNWPSVTNLANIEVTVVELAPYNGKEDDKQLMEKYWSKWLNSMNAKSINLIFQDAIDQCNQRITESILGNNSNVAISTDSTPTNPRITVDDIAGLYNAILNNHARSLRLTKISENDEFIQYSCDYVPLGIDFQGLSGNYNKQLHLLKIDKVGILSFEADGDNFTLVSNDLHTTFIKSK